MSHFLGMISPPILLLGMPGLVVAALPSVARLDGAGGTAWMPCGSRSFRSSALSWFIGTWIPFELLA